jgi:hypothetical protein
MNTYPDNNNFKITEFEVNIIKLGNMLRYCILYKYPILFLMIGLYPLHSFWSIHLFFWYWFPGPSNSIPLKMIKLVSWTSVLVFWSSFHMDVCCFRIDLSLLTQSHNPFLWWFTFGYLHYYADSSLSYQMGMLRAKY